MSESLLPPNASTTERHIEAATARLGAVPVPIRDLSRPDSCPAHLLPWLAWQLSVDNWSGEWSESQKRAVIQASFDVHRHKGTVRAMRGALDALGYELELVEWFQRTPAGDPYTFRASLTLDQVGIPTASAYDKIVDVANAAKNLRSHMDGVDVRAVTSGRAFVAARYVLGEVVNISAEPSA